MPFTPVCDGVIKIVNGSAAAPFQCYESVDGPVKEWRFVDYVEPTDTTQIYAQLVALNEFDPAKISGIVTFCLVLFTLGFGVGMVINRLRRS